LKAKEPRDRSASVRARLLNLARDRGEDFQITLRNYLFERFLYWLSRSELRGTFSAFFPSCDRVAGRLPVSVWISVPSRTE